MASLFDPIQLGEISLPNRIVMAPLTRSRAGERRTPNEMMRDYYVQRASAGLILTEATSVTPRGVGYADTPGLWSEDQLKGWRDITRAVHEAGGRIMLQLWHVGRISHPTFLHGALPVAPSPIAPDGHVSLLRPQVPYVVPHALSIDEIEDVVGAYRRAAVHAKNAGFDGVEIHAANGYLIDQFLQSKSNQREDKYGGSVENRARFLLEVTDAVVDVWGAGRVGVHLSPRGDSNHIGDANPRETFTFAATELGKRKLAFLFIREKQGPGYLTPDLRKAFGGPVIANEGLSIEEAGRLVAEDSVDAVSFGKLFIANPDLVERIRAKAPLNPPDPTTFYAGGAKGYIDYPSLAKNA